VDVHSLCCVITQGNSKTIQTQLAETHTDLNDLRCVAAIVETGSLSGAARRLHVNHATVFRRLAQMEEKLGVAEINSSLVLGA
jgi:molybdenum-dependent DNA-binding transcriptional regulator ModE